MEIYPIPIEGTLSRQSLIEIKKVMQPNEESIWNEMVGKYHYLGYEKMIGQRLKYLVLFKGKAIAFISFNRAALRVKARDSYIGWDEAQKLENLHRVVNNNRFLILPWIKVKNLASYILGHSLKHLKNDWEQQYGTKLLMVETFVDAEKYKGTCYIAANWKHLGETKGFGKVGNTFVYHGNGLEP